MDVICQCSICKNKHNFYSRKYMLSKDKSFCPRCNSTNYKKLDDLVITIKDILPNNQYLPQNITVIARDKARKEALNYARQIHADCEFTLTELDDDREFHYTFLAQVKIDELIDGLPQEV